MARYRQTAPQGQKRTVRTAAEKKGTRDGGFDPDSIGDAQYDPQAGAPTYHAGADARGRYEERAAAAHPPASRGRRRRDAATPNPFKGR